MREICLFPLSTVLFPGMPLPLHIFEPRYQVMIQRCLEEHRPFGVVLIRQGVEALGPLADPYSVGCTANIVQVERLEHGRMNILALGEERFRIHDLHREQAYLTGTVEVMPIDIPHTLSVIRAAQELKPWVTAYLQLLATLGDAELDLGHGKVDLPEDALMMTYMAAALLQVPTEEKQTLLESETAAHLMHKVSRLYRRELAILSSLREISPERANQAAWLN